MYLSLLQLSADPLKESWAEARRGAVTRDTGCWCDAPWLAQAAVWYFGRSSVSAANRTGVLELR
jgi:hypothetical protein